MKKSNTKNWFAVKHQKACEYQDQLRQKSTRYEKRAYTVLRSLYSKVICQKIFHTKNSFYIVDLFIPSINVVIEIDGDQHINKPRQVKKDEKRDKFFKDKGILLIRVENRGVECIDWKFLIETEKKKFHNAF